MVLVLLGWLFVVNGITWLLLLDNRFCWQHLTWRVLKRAHHKTRYSTKPTMGYVAVYTVEL